MATALTTQLQQLQHHRSQQLEFILPASSGLTTSSVGGVSSSPARSSSPTPSPVGIENFCKECGLAFESHTSLEIHLSYHRANLLSRWAAQDPNSASISAPIPNTTTTTTIPTNQNSIINSMDSKPPPQGPSYYDQNPGGDVVQAHPHYNPLPPDYHNSNGGGGEHHLGSQFNPRHHHHNIFNQEPPLSHGGGHYDPRQRLPELGSREKGEEILDLDSNKVHIYNLPQQQLQYLHANSFYRPYLMNHQSGPIPTNGNPPQPHHHHHHHHLPPPPPFPGDAQHGHVQQLYNNKSSNPSPPQRSPSNVLMSPYEFSHGQHAYPPPDHHHSNPANYHQGPPTFRGSFPPQKFQRESPEPNLNSLNLVPGAPPVAMEGKKGKKAKVGAGPPPLNGPNEDSNSPAPPPKTKGWKGGECKRPKTYNCTACNKWFTSSGHLKRHYGTTLHKNSLRQRGENPDEQPPVVGKKKKEMQLKQQQRSSGEDCNGGSNGGDSNNGIDSSSSTPSHHPNMPNAIKSDEPTPTSKSTGPTSLMSNGRGVGLVPDFGHQGPPPTTSSYPSNPPTYLHVYHNGPQGPPPPPPQPPYMGQFHPSFGYDSGHLTSPPNVYAVSVPTSMYGGGYPPGLDIPGSQLPPFGTVLSPYDTHQFGHHMTTAGPPVYIHQGGPPPPGSPPYDSESGVHSNSTSDGTEHHLKNGESPEAVRSASAASGLEVSSFDEEEEDEGEGMSDDGVAAGSASTGFSSGSDESETSMTKRSLLGGTEGGGGGQPAQVLKCSDCSKTFNRTCYLTQHTNSSHSGGKPFKCPTCGKRFPEAPALSDHVAKHGDNKPYKCELCPKQFNHKTDLRRHLCLHTGEKPYTCDICGKGFIRKDHMNKHCETHGRKVKGGQPGPHAH